MTATEAGKVIDRPTGELAFLWQAYARSLDRIAQLQKEKRKLQKKTAAK